jgi:cytochrome c biogenesis protein CcmG, thiol:disulfide interchange protein DsbE
MWLLTGATCFFGFATPAGAAEPSIQQRVKAPAFTARDLRNKLVSTDTLLAEGPLIIDFWATWCAPCKEEFKALKKIVTTYRAQNLRVLAVNEDGPSEITKVRQTVAMTKLPFIVVTDNDKSIMELYNVTALPSLFLVGTDGTIHLFSRGYIAGDEKKLEQKIQELLAEEQSQ